MSKIRLFPPRRRQRRSKELLFLPSIQSLEDRLMLTGNPSAFDDPYTAIHDRALIATTSASGVLRNDSDPNGYLLSASVVTGPAHGSLSLNADGTFVYMPNAGYAGPDSFTYKDYDGVNYSSNAVAYITVQENTPVASAGSFSGVHDRPLAAALPVTDGDGDPLTGAAVTAPAHGSVAFGLGGTFSYTPNAGFTGTDSFTYTVSDGPATSSSATISLTVTDSAPVANTGYYATPANTTLTVVASSGVLLYDTDADSDLLTASVVTNPSHGTLSPAADGSFTYTPTAGYTGLDSFTYKAYDGASYSGNATTYVYVGNQFAFSANTSVGTTPSATEGAATANAAVIGFNSSYSSTQVTAIIQWGDGSESAAAVTSSGGKGSFVLTLAGGHTYQKAGTYPLSFVLNATASGGPMAVFTYTVATAPRNATIADAALTGTATTATVYAGQPTSLKVGHFADANTYGKAGDYAATVTWTTGGTAVAASVVTASGGGFDVYANNPYATAGTYAPVAHVSDAGGSSANITSSVTVAADPLAASATAVPATAGQSFSGTVASFTDNRSGPSASALTATIAWGDGTSTVGTIASGGVGTYLVRGVHTYATPGVYTTTIQVSDNSGAVASTTGTATAAGPINDSYTMAHDRAAIATTAASGVLTNDYSASGGSLTAIPVAGPLHGTFTLKSDGSFVYMPNSGYVGADSFTYKDYDGTSYSVAATVSITVGESTPIANVGSFTIAHDHTLNGSVSMSDAENDPLTASLVSSAVHGALALNADGTFSYVPNPQYYGSDSFTYHVSDGISTNTTATVSLTVAETAPVANTDYYAIGAGVTLDSSTSLARGVQAYDADAEGDIFSSQVVAIPSHGTLAFKADGSFTYTPNAGYTGLDSFTYKDFDGLLSSPTATVYIYVGTQTDIDDYGSFHDPVTMEGTVNTDPEIFNWDYFYGVNSDYSAMVQWGDGTESPGVVYLHNSHVGYTIKAQHAYAKYGNYPITVVILGDAAAQNALMISTGEVIAIVSDAALTGSSVAASTIVGQLNSLKVAHFTDANPLGNAADYAATVTWTAGGATLPATVVAASGGGFDVFAVSPYTTAGTYSPAVHVSDAGGSFADATSTVTVTANPIVATNVVTGSTEGSAFSGNVATFFDNRPGTAASLLTAIVDYGDGHRGFASIVADPSISGQYDVVGSNTYIKSGAYTVSVTIYDQGGATAYVGDTMTVADATISATASPLGVTEGQAFGGVVAHFTDSNPSGASGDYWATIDWGDGQFSQGTVVVHSGGGFDVTGSNTYGGRGSYTTTIRLGDQFGSNATVSGAVTVTVNPPLVTIVATQPNANTLGTYGVYTVSRTGDVSQPLTVNYAVSGVAQASLDYQALPGSVTIPAGAASAPIVVNPLSNFNPLAPNPENVVVTLLPSTGVPLAYSLASQSITATDTTSGITGTDAGIVVSPAQSQSAAAIQIVGVPASDVAGTAFSVTVTALDAGGNVQAGYIGKIHFTSSDAQATLPADYAFTTADAGAHTFSVTFKTAGLGQYLKATDTAGTGIATLSVVPASATHLSLNGFPASVQAGSAQGFIVTALDAYNNVVSGYTGTVHLTSSDATATLPGNYTFTSSDGGVHTFAATLNSVGSSRTLTATDTVTSSISGTQGAIQVVSAISSTPAALVIGGLSATTTAGAVMSFTVTAKVASGSTLTSYLGTVHFTSSDWATILPADYTFTAGDAGVHTFSTALVLSGSRSLRVSDTTSASVTGIATVNVAPASTDHLGVANLPSKLTAGSTQNLTVTAYDIYGRVTPGYAGTVHFSSGDPLAVLPADYTFTAADAGSHTFTAILHSAGTWSITAADTSSSGVSGTEWSVQVSSPTTQSAATLQMAGFPSQITAGSSRSIRVTALDANGNAVTGYRGTVHFSSTDPLAVLPADYTFTASDSGSHVFAATLVTSGTATIAANDSASMLRGATSAIAVNAAPTNPAVSFQVSGVPSSATAGAAFNITVTAKMIGGAIASAYTGTVHFSSDDGSAALPPDYTFTTGDSGTHTFTIAFKSSGTYRYVRLTDTISPGLAGTSTTATVVPAALAHLSLNYLPSPIQAGSTQSFEVVASDIYYNVLTSYAGTVHFTSSDPAASLPANYTFTSSDAGIHTFGASLNSVGTRSVTVNDTASATVNATASSIQVIAAQPSTAAALTIAGVSAKTTAGTAVSVTVTAKTAGGSTATGYLGTVHFTSGDWGAVLPADYTFTAADAGSHTFSVTFKVAGSRYLRVADTGATGKDANPTAAGLAGVVAVTIVPAAANHLAVSAFPSPVPSGSAQTFLVTAYDPYGNVAGGYTGTVHLTSSDATATLPADYAFTSADAGSHTFSGTLKAVGTQYLVATDTVTSAINGTEWNIRVTPVSLASGGLPASVTGCSPASITIVAKDSSGNVLAGYRGTVHFTSSDALATLPADYTFTSADAGSHTFSVTLKTAGTQSIAVTDASSGLLFTQGTVSVATSAGYVIQLSGYPIPTVAGVAHSFTVTEKDSGGNVVTGYTGTVHFISTDPQAVLPADYTFTSGDAGTHTFNATLKTAGAQSITAVDNSCCLGAAELGIAVQPATASSLSVTSFPSPVVANTARSFVVTAYDPYGNVATGYTGTVHFTSSDTQAILPANYTFVAGDLGSHTFNSTLVTASAQSSATVSIQQFDPSVYFMQGSVYNDLNANNLFDTSDTPIAGARVQLYKSDGTTLLGTTTTDANGSYLFTSQNVAGGLLPPGTYRLVETAPSGYLNEGVQSTSGFNNSTVTSSNSIQVTLADLTNLKVSLTSPGAGQNGTITGNGTSMSAFVGNLNLTLLQSGATLAQLTGDCMALFQNVSWGSTYYVTPQPTSTSLPYHAGQIAWLLDHYGGSGNSLDVDHAAGLQLALWELQIDATPDLSSGNFIATSAGVSANAVADANQYITAATGQSAMAVFFNAKNTSLSNTANQFQGMIATDSFNFSNIAANQPTSSLSGIVYVDSNNSGKPDRGEPQIGGVSVVLSGVDDLGHQVGDTAVTASDGSYHFVQLRPGTYTLSEIGPAGYVDATDMAGTLGGTAGHDAITAISLPLGKDGVGYNFGWERAPSFSSTPAGSIASGGVYSYRALATDPDGDTLTYSILGPSSMSINSATGQVSWSPGASDVGTHPIVIIVSDGRGGVAQQPYTLTVDSGIPNRPPVFTSTPILNGVIGSLYTYQATAFDPDGDSLTFSFYSGPAGLTVSSTGLVSWTPSSTQVGTIPVSIQVSDGHGGIAVQPYSIVVPQTGGDPPSIYITSTPVTSYEFPIWNGGSTIVNDATIRDVQATFPDVQNWPGTGTAPGLVNAQLGDVQIVAGAAGTALPAILDNSAYYGQNSQLSFSTSGSAWTYDWSGGYNDDQLESPGTGGGTGANSATWQVGGLASGDYLVQATWYNKAGQATNATYTLKDGSTTLTTATVNQASAPSGTTYNNHTFQSLAMVHVSSGSLKVVLADNANGIVAADAIRVVPAVDLSWSSFNGPSTGTAGGTATISRSYSVGGEAESSNFVIAYYASLNATLGQGGDILIGTETISGYTNLSVGTHNPTAPTLTLPSAAGTYHLFAVIEAGGSIVESDETDNIIAASSTIVVSGPSALAPTIVDDSGAGFTASGANWSTSTSAGYNGGIHKTTAGASGDTATWQLTGLSSGDYQVLVTWSAAAGQATNAPFTLKDGSTIIQTVTINESLQPSGSVYSGGSTVAGKTFQALATVHVTTGTLNVVLTDTGANAAVVADAIRVSRAIDLNWSGGGIIGPTTEPVGGTFTVERQYNVVNSSAAIPDNFVIAYYASTAAGWGGGTNYLLGTETISSPSDKVAGLHDGTSPALQLPPVGGTYYLFAIINASGSVLEGDAGNNIGIGRDASPTYTGALPYITSPQTFYDWYHDVPGVNLTEQFPLVLTPDGSVPGQYDFVNDSFLPIDGQLFGNDNPQSPVHNFNFMVEFHGSFIYRGGEQLRDWSDDDSWVFINNKLALDNGGLHSVSGFTINVDTVNQSNGLGLVIGGTYPIDFFYAERHTNEAAFEVQTTLQIVPESPLNYQVTAVDSDGGSITYALLNGPVGMTIVPQTGLLYWQPGHDQLGTYQVTVEAIDASGATATQTFPLVVSNSAGADGPHFSSSAPTSVDQGGTYAYQPVVTGPAGDPLHYSVTGPNIGPGDKMSINPVTGAITWTPQPGDYGQHFLVTIQVADNQGLSDTQQYTLQVGDVTDSPPAFTFTPVLTAAVGQHYSLLASAIDPDYDPLIYSLAAFPKGMVINPSTGDIDWTPLPDEQGAQIVTVGVRDGRGGSDSRTFTITVGAVGSAPIITSTAPTPAYVGQLYSYQVTAVDPSGLPLTYSVDPATAALGVSISSSGLLTWPSPVMSNPSPTIRFIVSDGLGSVPWAYLLPVVPVPGTGTITFASTPAPRGVAQIGRLYQYQPSATDTNDYPLTYSLDATQYPAGMTINPSTGLVTWTPSQVPSQLGTNTVKIWASDGHGATASKTFTVVVGDQETNHPPTITSVPSHYAVAGVLYRYNLQGSDLDGDPLTWGLESGPSGMVLDPATNSILWTPTSQQAGTGTTWTYVVSVQDGHGGVSMAVPVYVIPVDVPPMIDDTYGPPTQAGVGVPYSYQVPAYSPIGLPLTYTLLGTPPSGMSISPSGLLQWTSPTPSGGNQPVSIQVADSTGATIVQNYTISILSSAPAKFPTFTSQYPKGGTVGTAYAYTALASDPQGYTLTYSIPSPLPGMSINSSTGAITWSPAAAGTQHFVIVATAATSGLKAYQDCYVNVETSQSPSFTSGSASVTVTAGKIYSFAAHATDAAGDAMTYALVAPPSGMTIDSTGHITWATSTPGAYTFQIKATTPSLVSVTSATYTVTVAADTTAPTVQIQMSGNPANVNSTVYFDVIAGDDVGVKSLTLTVGGVPVALDSDGRGSYFFTAASTYAVSATATDAAGNSTPASTTLTIVDPSFSSTTTVSITSPGDGAVITAPVAVTGSIADSLGSIMSYALEIAPLGSNTYTTIASGKGAIAGTIGTLDPTDLANGPYTLRLGAWNAGNIYTSKSITVNVSGTFKLGNLHLSFSDLTVPVAGIPITITRTYDSLNTGTSGDFGYGWTLSETSYQLKVDTASQGGGLGSFGDNVPFRDGTRVLITKPDGTTEGFTFLPQPSFILGSITSSEYVPYFKPDAGVTDTLIVPRIYLIKVGNEYTSGDGAGANYNPADPEFDDGSGLGGTYTLTTFSGLSTTFDAATGQVLTEYDRRGNTLTFQNDGIYSNSGRAVSFTRDTKGRITSITDPTTTHSIVYSYNAAGDLTSVTDRDGNVNTFIYDSGVPHLLTKITDGFGRTVMAGQYDGNNRLVSVKDASGNVSNVGYDIANLRETATAPGNAATTSNTYNSQGLLAQSVDADGNTTTYAYTGLFPTSITRTVNGVPQTTTYTYNAYGEPLTETSPSGLTTHYAYDAYGSPTSQSVDGGGTTYYSYDPNNGNLLYTTDPLGNSTSFGYDNAGDVLSTTTAAGTSSFTYDPYGDVLTATDVHGTVTTFTYDANGNQTSASWTWVDPNNASNHHTLKTGTIYDGNGNVKEVDQYVDGVITTSSTTLYDADGHAYSTTDSTGTTTTLYDINGRPIKTTTPDGMITDTVYDAQGRVIWSDDPHLAGKPADGTNTQYDPAGNVIATKQYANVVITVATVSGISSSVFTSSGILQSASTTAYDSAGRVATSTDPSNVTTTYHYDTAGNVIETDQTAGNVTRVSSSSYDSLGRVTQTIDPLGHKTGYAYNALGQLVTTTFDDGSTIVDTYDSQGRKHTEKDQDGNTTTWNYDQYGNLTSVALPDPSGGSSHPTYAYTYDIYGNQTSTTDPNGHVTHFTYDAFGHEVTHTLPGTQVESWTYNTLGQMATHTDFMGNLTTYTYNTLGQLTTKALYTYPNVDPLHNTATKTVTYADNVNYDAAGDYFDLTTTGGVTTSSEYDVHGNLIQFDDGQGTVVQYHYYPATGLESEVSTYKSGSSTPTTDIGYGYDPFGQLKQVSVFYLEGFHFFTALTTGYEYDADGDLVTTRNVNGTVEARAYDDLNRLTSVTTSNAAGKVAEFDYTYDKAGHRLTETDAASAANPAGRSVAYIYDALYRLTRESIVDQVAGNRTISYTYDPAGNRLTKADTGAPAGQQSLTYAYDSGGDDRLMTVTGTSGYLLTYAYDANGSTTRVDGAGGGTSSTYAWDLEGRMTSETNGLVTTAYTYDEAGNRTSSTTGGATTTYINDPNQAYDQVLEEYSGSMLAATYIRGLDLLFEDRSGAKSYYVKDGLDSTRALTNQNGAVTDTDTYDAFGTTIGSTGSTPNTYLFTGQQFDSNAQQYYLRTRYYNQSVGRFTAQDLYPGNLEYPQLINKYTYTTDDPVNYVDPSGMLETTEILTVSAITTTMVANTVVSLSVGFLAADALLSAVAWTQLKLIADLLDVSIQVDWRDNLRSSDEYFVHGTNAIEWEGSEIARSSRRDGDFGRGFYTFRADTEGVAAASRWATRPGSADGQPGYGFVLFVSMSKLDYASLQKKDLSAGGPDWYQYVNNNRSREFDIFSNTDLVFGKTARKSRFGPTSGTWIVNPNLPDQYAFKTPRAISKFKKAFIMPVR